MALISRAPLKVLIVYRMSDEEHKVFLPSNKKPPVGRLAASAAWSEREFITTRLTFRIIRLLGSRSTLERCLMISLLS